MTEPVAPSKPAEVHVEGTNRHVNVPQKDSDVVHTYAINKTSKGDQVVLSSGNADERDVVVINADGTGTVSHVSHGKTTRADAIETSKDGAASAIGVVNMAMINGIGKGEDPALDALRAYIVKQADGHHHVTHVDVSLPLVGNAVAASKAQNKDGGRT